MSTPDELWRAAQDADGEAAQSLTRQAAEAGHPDACNAVGEAHLQAGDLAGAAKWFERAGTLGSAVAWFSLGRLHGNGQGVPQDMERAHDCMRKAAALGDERARQFVRDALGEDPDATPAPQPPAPAQASRRGWIISAVILGVIVLAAVGGAAILMFPDEPVADAGVAPVATVAAPQPDAAMPDAALPDATVDAARPKTQVFSVFAGDGYPPSPRIEGQLLTRTLGVKAKASSSAGELDAVKVDYSAAMALDGKPDTWWQEGAEHNGLDEWLEVRWAEPGPVAVIRLVPGYLKRRSDKFGDRWKLNNRLAKLQVDLGQGRTFDVNLEDQRGWHDITVEPPVETDHVRLTIKSVFAGKDPRTGDPVNDSGISEIQVWTR